VHFLELTSLIKRGLRDRLELPCNNTDTEQDSVFTSVYNWFYAIPAETDPSQRDSVSGASAVMDDKKFLQALQRELKLYEVCVRIFE